MNIAQLLFSSNLNQAIPAKVSNEEGDGQLFSFEQMLNNMFSFKKEKGVGQLHSFGLIKEQADPEQLNDLLHIMLNSENDVQIAEFKNSEKSVDELNSLLMKSITKDISDVNITDGLIVVDEASFIQQPEDIQAQWTLLAKEINDVYTKLMEEGNIPETANRLISLLERWSELNRTITNENRTITQQPIEFEDTKLQSLWKNLVTAYERRNSLNQIGQYNSEAKVDQKTVVKWLQHALHDQDEASINTSRIHQQSVLTNPTVPMSRIEQYVIYIQQSDQTQSSSVEQQLIDKFSQAMRTSRFLSMNNGVTQMMFHLKPDNLGEMLVRLVEVNGEMTAKIIVTSEATRKALQSNIHQLKNMFSPHQVVIERQDEMTSHQTQEEQEQLREQDENDDQSFHKQGNHGQENETDESESFHEILNEKV